MRFFEVIKNLLPYKKAGVKNPKGFFSDDVFEGAQLRRDGQKYFARKVVFRCAIGAKDKIGEWREITLPRWRSYATACKRVNRTRIGDMPDVETY